MKKTLNWVYTLLIAVGCWFVSIILLIILSAIIWPGVEVVLPEWYVNILIFLPLIIAICAAYMFRRKRIFKQLETIVNQKNVVEDSPQVAASVNTVTVVERKKHVPNSQKAQEELAKKVVSDVHASLKLAKTSVTVSQFIVFYDKAVEDLSKLLDFDKLSYREKIPVKCAKLNDELQLHLCDAIVRAKDNTILEIKGKYKNSREYQEKAVGKYEAELENIKERFTVGTSEVAIKNIVELRNLVGMEIPYDMQAALRSTEKRPEALSGVEFNLEAIDIMEGHQFEYWCADALKDCGFINVEVTPGSGDQGVDVLAEKDGIKYAVQCKRYNSDLGNTPVQEVHSGKTFYHCHVGAVMSNRHFTTGAKKLAQETGTLLWDRDWIINYLNNKHCNSGVGSNCIIEGANK